MSNKSSNLGAAIRGRSMVTRDYTRGVRFKGQERKADERVNLGLIKMITTGASLVQSGANFGAEMGENVEMHKELKSGAERIWEDSPEGKSGVSFEKSGFEEASWWDRRFKPPEEITILGGKEFDTGQIINLGKLDDKTSGLMGEYDFETGDRKNLWDTFLKKSDSSDVNLSSQDNDFIYFDEKGNEVSKDKSPWVPQQQEVNVIADKTATDIIKDNVTADGKNNQVANLNNNENINNIEEPKYSEWKEIEGNENKRMRDYFAEFPTLPL